MKVSTPTPTPTPTPTAPLRPRFLLNPLPSGSTLFILFPFDNFVVTENVHTPNPLWRSFRFEQNSPSGNSGSAFVLSFKMFIYIDPNSLGISNGLSGGWTLYGTEHLQEAITLARFHKVLITFFFDWLPIHLHAHASLSLRATEVKGNC